MPLGYFRRPLFLATAAYAAILFLLRAGGFFETMPSPECRRLRNHPSVIVEGGVISPLKEKHHGPRLFVQADRMGGRGCGGKIMVHLPRTPRTLALRPGQRLRLEGRLRFPRKPRNPGEFDEHRFLADRGISWVMGVDTFTIINEDVPPRWILWAWAETVRRSIEASFQRHLPQRAARLITALTLGYKPPLPRDLNLAVQDAGVMHLLVPSGAKVAFVIWAALGLGAAARLGCGARMVAALIIGGFYTIMVGGDAPYTRAFLAALALFAGRLLERESGTFQALVLSAALILLWEPRELFSAGFQMTYLAVGGLVLAMPQVSRALPRRQPRVVRNLLQVLAVSFIVQVMLWPVFAQVFGRGSLIGVLANIVLVPASGLMMGAGFLLWGVSFIGDLPAALWAPVVERLMILFEGVCRWTAGLPMAAIDLSPMRGSQILAFYLGAFSLLVLPRRRAALLLAAAGLVVLSGDLMRERRPVLKATLIHLPRGRACLISFPGGRHWLIDAGGPAGTILKVLKAKGVRRLERIIITGPEPGRWRGAERIIREVPVARLRLPRGMVAGNARLRRAAAARSTIVTAGGDGRVLAVWWGALRFEFGEGRAPRLLRGDAEYSIIPSRLRVGAVEVIIDGEKAQIKGPYGRTIH